MTFLIGRLEEIKFWQEQLSFLFIFTWRSTKIYKVFFMPTCEAIFNFSSSTDKFFQFLNEINVGRWKFNFKTFAQHTRKITEDEINKNYVNKLNSHNSKISFLRKTPPMVQCGHFLCFCNRQPTKSICTSTRYNIILMNYKSRIFEWFYSVSHSWVYTQALLTFFFFTRILIKVRVATYLHDIIENMKQTVAYQ